MGDRFVPLAKLPKEQDLLRVELFPGSGSANSMDNCVHKLFEAQAERTPDAVAVVCEDQQLTYGELNARANQMARHLRTLAVGPETAAAICLGRSPDMVVSILGILKAGGAWLPLDPGYPKDRLEFMLKNARVSLLVTQESFVADLPEHLPQTVLLDADWRVISLENRANLDSTSAPENLAYVIYTSGSTGPPKGVMIPHRCLSHYVQAMREPLGITAKDVYLHTATIAFSSSVRQLMLPLTCGARIVIATADKIRRPTALFEIIKNEGVTIIDLVPSYWRSCVNALAELETAAIRALLDNDIRLIVTASEPLMFDLPKKWTLELKHGARLINMFGQTETTGIVSVYPIPPGDHQDGKIVCIGRPLTDTRIYLLDSQGQPVSAGAVGEIHVAGDGLARGYLNQPEPTAERFVPNPFSDEPGARLYRTGDLGRHLPDGTIEFVGRTDQQVKIRGFRVELGEIDSVLNCHAAVRHAVVIAREDVPGEKRLVAYIVPDPAQNPTVNELRGFLAKKLPHYLVPASFVFLESLPLTPTGKVDPRALLAPEPRPRAVSAPFVAPRTETETTLCSIWSDLLKVEEVGIDDNFFELGGDSILSMEMIARAEQGGIQIVPERFFNNPSIRAIAVTVCPVSTQGSVNAPPIIPHPEMRYESFPLTDIQQAYWVGRLEGVELGGVSTHRYFEIDCDGLHLERLNLAWQRVVERHDMLRAIVSADGRQRILETVPPYRIKTLDLRRDDPDTVRSRLNAVRESMSHQVLPSDQWPLFEIRASLLDDRRFRLHLSFDALVVDARSRNLLFAEWSQLYQDPTTGLPPLELSFRDYVTAEVSLKNSDAYRRADDYWRNRLVSLPPAPELPLAKSPNALPRSRFKRFHAQLDEAMWTQLKDGASRRRLRPTVLLLAAFAEVLKVWSRSPRMTINLTLFNRMARDPRLKGVVGDFTSSSLIAIDNEDRPTFETRALQVQQQLDEDLKHSCVSGVQVLRQLAKRQDSGFRAIMPVVFTSLFSVDVRFRDSSPMDWLGEVVYTITQTPQVLIDHQTNEQRGSLVLDWDVVEELFPSGMVQEMFQSYTEFLRRLANDERSWQERWSDTALKLIPPNHLRLQASANATRAQVSTGLLHTLFSEQVSRRADHPAVVSPSRCLTYNELSRRSFQVAHWLRRQGATPNHLVAVVMEKGWEQIVAVLGVLRSGAAYVPIDPNLPKERHWHLLDHGEVQLALTQPCIDKTLEWPECIQRLCVSDASLEELEDTPLDEVQRPKDLAYVIYTSGSTGLPKGVMIDHRGAVNTILDINHRFGVNGADRVLALSSLSFDLSVYDIFGTLAAGGTIVIPEASAARDPAQWAEIMLRENVTVWNSVPALMELLIEYLAARPERLPSFLRLALLSGDWIPVSLPDRIGASFPGVQVISLGGATEASIWSILYPIDVVDPVWKSIPYGRPMANQSFQVFNDALERCPVWVPGQLYIGGIGLAKGYWRDEEKSRASFIHHPRTGERLYKTGDLGRYLPDGNIEFLGREDFQVKIQGYRVELGEIEATLLEHPGIRAAVVTAAGQPAGDKRLVAYVVPEQHPSPTQDELSRFLAQKVPDYMLPSGYVILDRLPLTANGKVDRQALPQPPTPSSGIVEHLPAEKTDLVTRIGRLAANVLKVNRIDPEANLLSLGATSTDMIRIVNSLDRELSFRPKMDVLYRFPTVAALASSYQQQLLRDQTSSLQWETGMEPTPKSPVASFKLLVDPEEREAFKNRHPGLRQGDNEKACVELPTTEPDDTLKRRYAEHRSHRRFASEPITLTRLSQFLSCLRQIELNGKAKYLYASAGGLYPVQTYLHIKPGRIEGLSAGTYYYHPAAHRLVLLAAEVDLDRGIYHPFINAPIFDEAAFALFLIAQLKAIAPMYGERSLHFATLEAGEMSHLLESAAPGCGIGLCQIGTLEFSSIRDLFTLDEGHMLVHSLLGGGITSNQDESWSPFQEPYQSVTVTRGDREEGTL